MHMDVTPPPAVREERPAPAMPLQGVLDARAVHVVCIGGGSPAASEAARRACTLAVDALKAAGRGEVSEVAVGDPRTGEPGRLIVGLRLDQQAAADGLPAVMIISGQTLRPDLAGGRVVPARARALSPASTSSPPRLRASVVALLNELGVL